jgi:hypothetical protein
MWGGVAFGALFILPRALAAVRTSSTQQRSSTIPQAAAQTQAARAINTAGLAGNTALARILSQMLSGKSQKNGSSSGQRSGSSGATGGSSTRTMAGNMQSSLPSVISYVDPSQIHMPDFAGYQQEQQLLRESNVEAPDPVTMGGSDWDPESIWFLNSDLPSIDDVSLEAPDPLTVAGYYGPDNSGDLSALDFLNDTSGLAIPIPEMVEYYGDGGGSSNDDQWGNYPDEYLEY